MLFKKWKKKREYPRVITVIGSGGKTSWMKILRDFFLEMNEKVVMTTTTKMFQESYSWISSKEEFEKEIKDSSVIYLGKTLANGKVDSVEFLDELVEIYQEKVIFLIEGDGSKRLPFKVPNHQEPVILPSTQMLFLMVGTWALGKTFQEGCHRFDLAVKICHKETKDMITIEDVWKMIQEGYGSKIKDFETNIILNGSFCEAMKNPLINYPVYFGDIKETRDVIRVSKD